MTVAVVWMPQWNPRFGCPLAEGKSMPESEGGISFMNDRRHREGFFCWKPAPPQGMDECCLRACFSFPDVRCSAETGATPHWSSRPGLVCLCGVNAFPESRSSAGQINPAQDILRNRLAHPIQVPERATSSTEFARVDLCQTVGNELSLGG